MKTRDRLKDIGEFGFIESIRSLLRPVNKKVVGAGDDTAVLPGSAKDLLLTTDMLIEGRHFSQKQASGYEIGRKALAVNISDIAAMAGTPRYAVVSLGAPSTCSVAFLHDIYRGMKTLASEFGVEIVGGDTDRSDKLILSVTLLGEVKKEKAIYRCGAKPGDWIFVTGPLGGSYVSKKHLNFIPRVRWAQKLSQQVSLHAMIDISDGLLQDLSHICEESRVGAVLFAPQIPMASKAASLHAALSEGEDFELLFTVSSHDAKKLLGAKIWRGILFPVGRITAGTKKVKVLDAMGRALSITRKGYDHFC